jgi:hypothetical protein
MTQFLEANPTCPELGWCLGSILSSQIRGTEPTFGTKHGRDAAQFQALLHAQHALGWINLLKDASPSTGVACKKITLIRTSTTSNLKLDRKFHSGDTWTCKLIALLWTTVRACWDHRNSACHGTNKEENPAIGRTRLLVSIQALYTDAPQMLAADRVTLTLPIEARLKKSPAGLKLWLLRTRNIAKLSKRTALDALKCTHKTLTKYFQPRQEKKTAKENTDRSQPI